MRFRTNLLLSTAFLAAMASSAFGQGLGYPEAPHHTVSRAARYWFDDGYIARACTGRIGFMATNGCDHKPICSLCDYSRPRVCGCAHRTDLLSSISGWFQAGSCGKSGGCKSHQKFATQKCATQKKTVAQKLAKPKCAPQKRVVQKYRQPKYVTQKCPQQKCVTQKCAPQKCAVQKRPTQKCSKSCGGKSSCGLGCGPSLLDSVADHIASLDLFRRPNCGCKSKCGSCRPTLAKSKSKSGGAGIPSTLPLPDQSEEGEGSPEVDPAIPPDPSLEDTGEVGTGTRSARPNQPRWRRARSPRSSMPRLLPADNSARDVSRISYEELIDPAASRKLDVSQSSRRLDVFKAASKLDNADSQAAPKLQKVPADNSPANPLRK